MNSHLSEPNPKVHSKKKIWPRVFIGGVFVLLIMLPLYSIFAVIASSAYRRSIEMSRTSETKGIMRQLSSGAQSEWMSSCSFPPPLAATGNPTESCGGAKHVPVASDPAAAGGVSFTDPMYFIYSTEVSEQGEETLYTIRAQHDFDCESREMHTIEARVIGTKNADGTCDAVVEPSVTLYKFE